MCRFLKMFLNRRVRQSLWWNLKRIIVEHMYDYELDLLDKYYGREDLYMAFVLYEELYRNQYLQSALIRMDTLYSFMRGDD